MVLLGINLGYGNADVGRLPLSAVNLDTGWVDFPRPKTGHSAPRPALAGDGRGDAGGAGAVGRTPKTLPTRGYSS